jgi:structure-specific recognition protein 1
VQRVLQSVLKKAVVVSAKGNGIVTFNQVVVKTPRGRYDLEIFPNFFRMKGTQSSTISYDSITRITQLSTLDDNDSILVVRPHLFAGCTRVFIAGSDK